MSNEQTKKTTDQEIERIDNILNKLDELMKELPVDYQMDWIQEQMSDLGLSEE